MAEQVYKLLYGGHEVEIQGPEGATDEQLQTAAADYLKAHAPKTKFPPAVIEHRGDPNAPPVDNAALSAVANDEAAPPVDLKLDDPKALAALTARTDALTKKLPTKEAGRTGGTGVPGLDDLLSTYGEFGIGAAQGPYNAAAFITDPLLRPFVGSKAVDDVRAQRANLVDAASRTLVAHPSPIARGVGQIAGTLPVAELRAPAAAATMFPRLAPIAERGVQGALMGAGVRDQDASAGGSAGAGALANVVLPPVAGAVARRVLAPAARYVASKAPAAVNRAGRAAKDALDSAYDTVGPLVGAEAPVTAPGALTEAQQAYQLAQKYNIDLMPADVGGGLTKGLTAGTAQTLIGGPAVLKGAKATQRQFGEAVGREADKVGLVMDPVDAGDLAKKGAADVLEGTGKRGGQLYDRIKKQVGNRNILPSETVKALDEQIADLSQSNDPTDPVLKHMLKLREQVAGENTPDGLTYDGMRRVISNTKAAHRNEDLLNTDAERRLGIISEAMDKDVSSTLKSIAPGLDAQYQRANQFWRERADTAKKVFKPLVSADASGESVVTKLNQMFQGKGKGAMMAGRFLDELPLVDARTLRATIINNMGKAKPSAAEPFSSETFLTNWNSTTMRGRKFLTNRDPELGKSLSELATLAKRMRESSAMANKSQTGRAVNVGRFVDKVGTGAGMLLGAHETGDTFVGSVLGVAGAAALEGLTGRALSSQPLVKLLVRAGSIRTPGAAENWARSMASLAARSPELRDDIAHVLSRTHGTPPPAEHDDTPLTDKPSNPYADLDENALKVLAGDAEAAGGADVGGGAVELPLDNPNLLPETVELAPRVLHQESRGDPNAVSPAGAEGLMQVMPHTGRDPGYGIAPLKDHSAVENARFGVDYLDAMLRKHNAHKVLGLMAYNWGPGDVDKWLKGGRHLSEVPMETRHYVNNILRDDVFPLDH